ncbi:hypothetical protein EG329_000006 [Mollisiaceae sp. DMI_Dod_QoI]|nr:hypothetical protein EG329_000006 [Helotiales sp. DMI_Dod_QoI]
MCRIQYERHFLLCLHVQAFELPSLYIGCPAAGLSPESWERNFATAHEHQGQSVNKEPRTHDYYEVQSKEDGLGVAFQRHTKAALNTGIEGPVPLDIAGLSMKQQQILNRLTDLAGHYAELTMEDLGKTLETLESENISTALLFAQASRSGTLNTSVACGPRNFVGEALEIMTYEARKLADLYLPWLTINFHFNAQVIDVNLRNPQKPILTVQHQGDGEKETLVEYDFFVKVTGTTWEAPVKGNVANMAFTGVPNPDDLWSYMSGKKLMRVDDRIKPGTKILIGGTSLSAFDPVGILLTRTGIVKLDSSTSDGFRIDEVRASQYHGLITFFNRSQGEVVASRHTHAVPIPEEAALFTPEMILSQQLQKSQDPFQVYLEKARLLTAIHFKKLPKDIIPSLKTPEQFARIVEEDKNLATDPSTLTEPGMIRAALLSFLFFFALGSDPERKQIELDQQYPLLVRHGWDACRSATFNATHALERSEEDSSSHLAARRTIMNYIAAAPFPIHHLITRLYQLGVVSWEHGAYDQVSWSAKEQRFLLNGKKAHGLIAAGILTANADALSTKILAQVKKPAAGESVYHKGRFPLSSSGAYIHIIELGLPGHGRWNEGIFVNTQWADTNSYEAAHQLMPIVATTIRILENMFVRRLSDPVERLMELYRQTLPLPSAFSRQAEALRKPYEECHGILAFAKFMAEVYPDGKDFSNKMKCAQDRRVRDVMVEEMRRLGGENNEKAYAVYQAALERIKFEPFDLDTFEETSPDFSSVQIKEMKRIHDEELHQDHLVHLSAA